MRNPGKIKVPPPLLNSFMRLYVDMYLWKFRIQINDQGRELVNEVSKVLHSMIVTENCMTSVYHPQSSGLCEGQNRTIKNSLLKILDWNPCDWPNIIEGNIFAHRVSKHTSTQFSPFFLRYNQGPTLPVEVKHSLVDIEGNESERPFDKETFDAVFTTEISMTANIHQTAVENISSAQEKQRRDYNRSQYLTRLKWVKKCFWRIKEGWTEKLVNFHLNGLAHSQLIRYQIRTFAP